MWSLVDRQRRLLYDIGNLAFLWSHFVSTSKTAPGFDHPQPSDDDSPIWGNH
jgi:hypothetical protein